MNPLISIITPTYNSFAYIEDTILSIREQSYTNWELILVDDCSKDQTISILERYSKLDERIKYFSNKINSGAGITRNLGLSKISGSFLCFLDSDDLWEKNKLKIQLEFMIKNNYPISFTTYELINEQGIPLNKAFHAIDEIDYEGYMKNTIIGMSTSMINLEIIGDIRFKNIRTRQDMMLWLTLFKKGFKAYGIKENLGKYRVREDSISSNKIRAAKQVWKIYNNENIGLFKVVYFFMFYIINSIRKRF